MSSSTASAPSPRLPASLAAAARFAARARRRGAVAVLLVAVVGVGAVLRFDAATGRAGHASADQRAYVRLATDLREYGTYGDHGLEQRFHWAPGTPALLAAADAVAGRDRPGHHGIDLAAARRGQALVGTLTVLCVFALATLVGGPWAGLVAAAAIALYPPAVAGPRTLLSEPLGALALTGALACLAWAWRGGTLECFALAGLVLGLACLTRADLLAAAAALPVGVAVLWRTPGRPWAGPARGAVLLVAAALAIVPWSQYATRHSGHLVPVTDGANGTLFLGTYLPGDGTVFGAKHALARRVRAAHPRLRHQPVFRIPAASVLDTVAADYRGRDRDAALGAAARRNLRVYALGHPGAFARMEAAKTWRMWGSVFRGTIGRRTAEVLWVHRGLLALALAGLAAGIVWARHRVLALVALALTATTAVDVLFVAEPRHALRLMPALVAAGAAGWALAVARSVRLRRSTRPASA